VEQKRRPSSPTPPARVSRRSPKNQWGLRSAPLYLTPARPPPSPPTGPILLEDYHLVEKLANV